MDQHIIAFPGLGIGEFTINSIAFTVFGFSIRWYGIFVFLGIFLGAAYWMIYSYKHYHLERHYMPEAILIGTVVAPICSKLYYMIFSGEKFNLLDLVNMNKGGFAIYGFIIGVFITDIIYCRIKNINFINALDSISCTLLLAQAIGRLGNFMNVEAYGVQTSVPWGMEITEMGKRVTVHPTFLYEILWDMTGFAILHFYAKKRKFTGEVFLMYTGWYGLGRAFIEGLRADSLMLGNFRISQVLAAVFFTASLIALIILNIKTSSKRQTAGK